MQAAFADSWCAYCRHLTGIADCLDEYLRKETGFMRLAQIPDVVRPRQRNLAVTVLKVMLLPERFLPSLCMLRPPLLAGHNSPGLVSISCEPYKWL